MKTNGKVSYADFLASKKAKVQEHGKSVTDADINPILFPFQRDLVRWSVRKGSAALFAQCGLGKSFMQIEWARLIGGNTLIVAPLSVSHQTIREGEKIGVEVRRVEHAADVRDGISITNYDRIDQFDPAPFNSFVLDESSSLKSITSVHRQQLTDMFSNTPYRLCCTATPAPNDIAEIANHAEFLGIMTRAEMLAMFFVHDDDGWRLKGHARDAFFRWLASWGMAVRMPSDLGYPDDGFILPPLSIEPEIVQTAYRPENALFFMGMKGIQERAAVRRGTAEARVESTAAIVNNTPDQWLVWCGLNTEADQVTAAIPGAVNVQGSDSTEDKRTAIESFQRGDLRVMVTKGKVAGFGMNFQNCHQMVFLGLNDSWELYYQCIRRCWRFGQTHPVSVRIIISDIERGIYDNVKRKEAQAAEMSEFLIRNIQQFEREELAMTEHQFTYEQEDASGDDYQIMLGDSAERLAEVEDSSIDLSVFSPPFISLYTYSPTERDIGNARNSGEFSEHFGFIADHLLRTTKPGRNCAVHVAQVPAMLARDGYIGMKDFRGLTISLFEEHGWIYHGEVCIDRDPQAQAIRTKAKALTFSQMRKDSSWLRPALADYILVFRKPGDNAVPIHPQLTNNEWIEWARPVWYGIDGSDTLNVAEGREDADERHIAPLQLCTIERIIRLWSNAGETILSPFMGIGSEGYQAIKLGRRFVGCELKRSYFDAAKRNLHRAEISSKELTLFDQQVEAAS